MNAAQMIPSHMLPYRCAPLCSPMLMRSPYSLPTDALVSDACFRCAPCVCVPSRAHRSMWTPVLYTNALSVVPCVCMGFLMGEFSPHALQASHARFMHPTETTSAERLITVYWVGLSCLLGLGISWTGFKCQSLITATAYTVVGVINKMLTVVVNVLIWEQHASPAGLLSLGICLLGGSLFKQSPERKAAVAVGRAKARCSNVDLVSSDVDIENARMSAKCAQLSASIRFNHDGPRRTRLLETFQDAEVMGEDMSGRVSDGDETTETMRMGGSPPKDMMSIESAPRSVHAYGQHLTNDSEQPKRVACYCTACGEPLTFKKGSWTPDRFCSHCGKAQY